MPAAITRWVGSPVMSAPSKRMRPVFGGVRPRIERISVVLPEPFEPSRQVILPGLDRQRDVLQHVGLVVGGGDALDRQRLGPLIIADPR